MEILILLIKNIQVMHRIIKNLLSMDIEELIISLNNNEAYFIL